MNTDNTQEKILDAARKVFVTKGMDGARMQEIADEADINKALLHYYFRTKQQLFDAIFEESMGKLVPNVMEIFKQKSNFREKIHFCHNLSSAKSTVTPINWQVPFAAVVSIPTRSTVFWMKISRME